MPTKLTRRAGTFAVVGAIIWTAAALVAIVRAISNSENKENFWESGYIAFSVLVFAAAICSTVLIFGLLRRTNIGRGGLSIVARSLAILGAIFLGVATWAWVVFLPFLTVAALVAVLRLRAQRLGSALFQWLLVVAWPVGIVLGLLLQTFGGGTTAGNGDHNSVADYGFATGSLLFAAGLAVSGRWLRSEESIDATVG